MSYSNKIEEAINFVPKQLNQEPCVPLWTRGKNKKNGGNGQGEKNGRICHLEMYKG